MFLAICYRESSPEQLQHFREEMHHNGKMQNQSMLTMMDALAKPNLPKKGMFVYICVCTCSFMYVWV